VTLVYPDEANINLNRISILAPVGAALIGLSIGQTIEFQTADSRKAVTDSVRSFKVSVLIQQHIRIATPFQQLPQMFGRDESGRNDTGFQRFGQALDAAVEMEDVPICAMESYRDWQPDCPTLTPTWADCSSRISSLSPVAPGRGKPHSPPISLQRRRAIATP
jgi:hypothetical protein